MPQLLKTHRPKHAISPHQEDYCDKCAEMKAEIQAKQTTMNRLQQAAASLPEDLQKLELPKHATVPLTGNC